MDFNPYWNEAISFELTRPELAQIILVPFFWNLLIEERKEWVRRTREGEEGVGLNPSWKPYCRFNPTRWCLFFNVFFFFLSVAFIYWLLFYFIFI
jgi:hypothetical protein